MKNVERLLIGILSVGLYLTLSGLINTPAYYYDEDLEQMKVATSMEQLEQFFATHNKYVAEVSERNLREAKATRLIEARKILDEKLQEITKKDAR